MSSFINLVSFLSCDTFFLPNQQGSSLNLIKDTDSLLFYFSLATMIRVQRLVFYVLFLVFFLFFSLSVFPRLKSTSSSSLSSINNPPNVHTPPPKKADPTEEKYLSWFPHR